MIDAMHHIRKKIIQRLTNAVSYNGGYLPIYNVIPNNANYPLIRVYSVSSNETDQNADKYNSEVITRIEVITRFDGDSGGEYTANDLISKSLNLLRTRSDSYLDLSSEGFTVYKTTSNGITYLTDDFSDYTYYRAILDLSISVTEN